METSYIFPAVKTAYGENDRRNMQFYFPSIALEGYTTFNHNGTSFLSSMYNDYTIKIFDFHKKCVLKMKKEA